jgi:putative membrane protein
MGYGILFRREMQLTYARMQDIHLSQNILERWLGIGTVTVQTAGSGASGNLTISGVKNFERIRDYLYARMRGVHDEHHEPTAAALGTDAVLLEIRDALRVAAEALKGAK